MVSPPSTTSTWPVMQEERSETRNRIGSAISETPAQRPMGTFPATASLNMSAVAASIAHSQH